MDIITQIIGNINDSEWQRRLAHANVETVFLNQWAAQKSRFVITTNHKRELAIALHRNCRIKDGDIVYYSQEENRAVVLRLNLNPVLVIDLSHIASESSETVMRIAVELGHALGNQHWPAIIKGYKVYVPLTVDKQVMLSVMQTHSFEGIVYEFQQAQEVMPYLSPHEVRRLFGGAEQSSSTHCHCHE